MKDIITQHGKLEHPSGKRETATLVTTITDDKITYKITTDTPPRPAKGGRKEKTMAQISIDNGAHYMTAQEAMPAIAERGLWDAIANVMDDDTREAVHNEIAPCTEAEFLARYLEIAADDLVIG